MSRTSPAQAPSPPRKLYFVNGWVDGAMIGGLGLVMFAAFKVSYGDRNIAIIPQIAFALSWVVNWPHFSATNYRLYHSRQNIAQYPVTALVLPFLIVGAMLASFYSPLGIAPYFVKLYLLWSPYHFSGQTVGITMIYARRAGFPVGTLERLGLSGFVYGTYVYSTASHEVPYTLENDYDVFFPRFGLPEIVPQVTQIFMYAFGALFLLLAIRWCIRNRRTIPPIILLPAVTQFVWFIPGSYVPAMFVMVPLLHGLQYLLIAWSMQLKEKMDENALAPSRRYVTVESIRWGILNVIGGACLFWLFPRIAVQAGFPLNFSIPVVISAVQIHHFLVDGVIWKLRNPKVSSPLLVNIDDMLRPGPKPASTAA